MNNRLEKIRLLALDVDGVLTDGTINISGSGEIFKGFNAKDGLGISCLKRYGVEVAVITGRKSDIIHRRAEELGISLLCEGIKDKYTALANLRSRLGLRQEETAYMGDDLNDLPAFDAAGVSFAPCDACVDVRSQADIVTAAAGGKGAVREVAELILKSKNIWQEVVVSYQNTGQGDKQ